MRIKTESGHFWIEYDNGYTLSVFNGYGSHTENHFPDMTIIDALRQKSWESETVEIAIFYNGKMITDTYLGVDDSVATVDLPELLKIMYELLNKKGGKNEDN